MTVIVYPDNTMCVDGRFTTGDVAAYGISANRPSRDSIDADTPIRVRLHRSYGKIDIVAFRQPSDFGERVRKGKLSSSLRKKNDARLRQQHDAIYAEYCLLRSNGARHDNICMALARRWVYSPKRIDLIVRRQINNHNRRSSS